MDCNGFDGAMELDNIFLFMMLSLDLSYGFNSVELSFEVERDFF